MPCPQARYWMATVATSSGYTPHLEGDLVFLKGQKEIGGTTNYEHWQLMLVFSKKVTMRQCKSVLHNVAHVEPTKSEAAEAYVWKEDTRVEGSQFQLGNKPKSLARQTDWDQIYNDAIEGNFDNIPRHILVRNYNSLKRIRVDNMKNVERPDVETYVYWGGSGLGKTRRAWFEAGADAYIKAPNTKWWEGYKGQKNVIIDEFTGLIAINYLQTWCDRYPCTVETKGSAVPLLATRFWITSNIDPNRWYPDLNPDQLAALRRRLKITHFQGEWCPPNPPLEGGALIELTDSELDVLNTSLESIDLN